MTAYKTILHSWAKTVMNSTTNSTTSPETIKDCKMETSENTAATAVTSASHNPSPDITVKREFYSRTVEYKDGKRVETKKGVQQVNDDWFSLSDDGSWVPTTKEQALQQSQGSQVSSQLIENRKPSSEFSENTRPTTLCTQCRRSRDYDSFGLPSLLLMDELMYRPLGSRLHLMRMLM